MNVNINICIYRSKFGSFVHFSVAWSIMSATAEQKMVQHLLPTCRHQRFCCHDSSW